MLFNMFSLLYLLLYYYISSLFTKLYNVVCDILCRCLDMLDSHILVMYNMLCTSLSCDILESVLDQSIFITQAELNQQPLRKALLYLIVHSLLGKTFRGGVHV